MAAGRRRLGLRARVVASFLVLLLVAELISIVVLHQVATNRLADRANTDLAVAVDDLRVRLEPIETQIGRPGGPTLASVFDDFLRARPARGDQAFLTYIGGQPFAASAGAPIALDGLEESATWATLRATRTGQVETTAGPVRWLAVPVASGDQLLGVFVAAEFLGDQQDALRDSLVTVTAVTLLVLVGASLLAWGAAGRAMAPLRDLATTARSVTTGDDLDARIEITSSDEVGDLATSFNEMMNRLQVAFDSQKSFLDDAGHELRTPITVVRGHLELLDDDPAVRADEVALLLDELDRMDRLVTDLRVLARSERPDFLAAARLDVDAFVTEVARKAEALAPRRWSIDADTQATIEADRQRLTQALLNLIGNAVHVTGDGDEIEIGASSAHGTVTFRVRDHGPGIDPDDVATLFDRTGRNLRRRPGGTGLGLPIAAAVARAHGGTISVTTEVGVGSCFEITVPAVQP